MEEIYRLAVETGATSRGSLANTASDRLGMYVSADQAGTALAWARAARAACRGAGGATRRGQPTSRAGACAPLDAKGTLRRVWQRPWSRQMRAGRGQSRHGFGHRSWTSPVWSEPGIYRIYSALCTAWVGTHNGNMIL